MIIDRPGNGIKNVLQHHLHTHKAKENGHRDGLGYSNRYKRNGNNSGS